jgi:hypothetical protein
VTIDLTTVQTPQQLAACLAELRGDRTLEAIDHSTARHEHRVPKSTVAEMVSGKHFPSSANLDAFLAACGVPPGHRRPWADAWERANRARSAPPAGAVRVRDTTLRELGVHPAIRLSGQEGDQPPYVPRDYDAELRERIGAGGFVLLRGASATGKTRSLAEAVRDRRPGRWLVQPGGVAAIEALAAAPPRDTVVWLDELQRHLTAQPALTSATIRALVHGGVLVVATIWPEDYQVMHTLRRPGPDDPQTRIREVLVLAQVVDVAPTFSKDEMAAAAGLADDPRVRLALADAELGVTQVLAAGPALVAWWEQGGDAYGSAVITAAADARRLGVTVPLSRALLEEAALGYLTPRERALAPDGWVDRALDYAITLLHGAASAVTPVDGPVGVIAGYVIADFLLQHARTSRRTVVPPDAVWHALLGHVKDGGALLRLADEAERRLRIGVAETAYRAAIDLDPAAIALLTLLLDDLGRTAEAGELAATIRRGATLTAGGMLRWQVLTGFLRIRRDVRSALESGRYDDAAELELGTTPAVEDAERAAVWRGIQAATDRRLPELLDEVHAGTPMAGRLYRLLSGTSGEAG